MSKKLKAVTFSYDDGVIYDKPLIEIFNKYGMKGTFNIITGEKEKNSYWKTETGVKVIKGDIDSPEWRKIYDGHEIACHTRNHPWLNKISDEEIAEEFLGNREDIKQLFGVSPIGAAYPFNTYDERCIKLLRENGFLFSRAGKSTHSFDVQPEFLAYDPTCHHNDDALFELAEKFINLTPDKPQIFYIWGHSYEFESDRNWDRIETLCKMLGGRDDIFYGTNSKCFTEFLK